MNDKIIEMKNTLEEMNSRIIEAEKGISELENRMLENTVTEKNKEKKHWNKMKKISRDISGSTLNKWTVTL